MDANRFQAKLLEAAMCNWSRRGCLITSYPEESSSLPRKQTKLQHPPGDELFWSLCDENASGPSADSWQPKYHCWAHSPQVPSSLATLMPEPESGTWKEGGHTASGVLPQSPVLTLSFFAQLKSLHSTESANTQSASWREPPAYFASNP